ncbi:MAG: hypothetical protein DRQ62_07245 [Gammaproteobacteria bacterium]|nr:MAG: hypothetical protein DRQ62_07245 [Gammaproteobacteria bacterium]
MRRLYRSGLFILAGAVLVLFLLLASHKFNHWLIYKATEMLPELSVIQVDGLLFSELHLRGLKYQAETVHISIDSASYRLNWASVFARKLQFDYLHLSDVNIVLLEAEHELEEEHEDSAFNMPVKIQVSDLAVHKVQISQNDARYQIEKINLALLYQGKNLKLNEFSLQSNIIQLDADAELQLEPLLPFKADLTIVQSIPELADITTRVSVQGDSQKIYLDAQVLSPSELHAQGWVELNAGTPRFDLTCTWPALQWPLQGVKQYASDNGVAILQGTVDDYLLSLDTDIFAQDLATGSLHLKGQGDSQQLAINTLTIKALAGEIHSQGQFSWTEKIPSQIHVLANNMQLAPFLAGYASELNLDAYISGRLVNEPDFSVTLNKLQGHIEEKPLKAKARIHYTSKQLIVENLQANIGKNILHAQGAIGEQQAISFTLDAANLHEISADLSGSVYAQATLQGADSRPVVKFKLQAEDLKFQEQKAGSIQAKGNLALAGKGHLDLKVSAQQLVVNSIEVENIELQSIGQFAHHELRMQVDSKRASAELAMQGSWHPNALDWQGEIRQLDFQGASAGHWQLIQAAPLAVKLAHYPQVETGLCLAQAVATGLICLTAEADRQAGQILAGDIKQLPLSVFNDWLPDTMQLESYLQAKFSLQTEPVVEGKIDIDLESGALILNLEQSGKQQIPFTSAEFDAELLSDQLQSNLSIIFNEVDHIAGQLRVTDPGHIKKANIDGFLNIQLENISFLDAFTDSVYGVSGEVNAQIVLRGLLAEPELKGSKIQLQQGSVSVPEMGLQLKGINVEINHSDQQQLSLHAEAFIAGQQLLIDGLVEQYFTEQFQAEMVIKGENLQLMQVPEMQVWVSPELLLKANKRGARLEGEVVIPRAELMFKSLPDGAVALSEDQVIITDKKAEAKVPRYPLDADITITLGDSVSVDGFGLKTHLQGQLHAIQKNNQLKLFNELYSVKGTYQAYGQNLTIEKGQLLFTGELENPGVNILASRKASEWDDKTIAYLRMTGTLKKPVTIIYTVPALNESESLAYLLTGAPLGKSDSSHAALLASAAMGLGRDYIDALIGVIGVDEFDMKSTSLGQNSMVIGKRISADLYARYIMDVLTSQMQFAVIYKLTQNISIETRAGSTHSSDIKYNIEFD